MIDSFLAEKRNYVKNVLMSKPQVLAQSSGSWFLFIFCSITCMATICFVWIKGSQFATLLPLEKIPFENQENILQFKVLATTFLTIAILALLEGKNARSYTITTQYISIEKNQSSQIVMLEDIKKLKKYFSITGIFTNKANLKITRSDNTTIKIKTIPTDIIEKIQQLHKSASS